MTAPHRHASALLFTWLGLVWVTFELFLFFDWGQGPVRVGLLGVLGALLWVWTRWAPRVATMVASAGVQRVALVLLTMGVLANLGPALFFLHRSHATRTVLSDQAETVMGGIRVLEDGANPYATDTVTDSFAYDLALTSLAETPVCREPGPPVHFKVGRADETVVPRIATAPSCRSFAKMFSSLGFKYGPVMLGFYWPFVTVLGTAGFLASHLLLVLALGAILYRWAEDMTGSRFWSTIALVPFLWPTALAWNVLAKEHLDFLPVCLVLVAWLLWSRRHFTAAAVCIGFSLAAKFLPALLFVPLLLRAPRIVWPLPFLIAGLCFAPFAIWDWAGFSNNIGYPFTRPPDSTALMFFCTPWQRILLRGLALATTGAALLRAERGGWRPEDGLAYVVVAHLAVLASGTTLHNNYLVWLVPLVPLVLIQEITRAQERAVG